MLVFMMFHFPSLLLITIVRYDRVAGSFETCGRSHVRTCNFSPLVGYRRAVLDGRATQNLSPVPPSGPTSRHGSRREATSAGRAEHLEAHPRPPGPSAFGSYG